MSDGTPVGTICRLVLHEAAIIAAMPVAGQGFKPARPVDLIVHNGIGSGVDVAARYVNGLLEREKLLPVEN